MRGVYYCVERCYSILNMSSGFHIHFGTNRQLLDAGLTLRTVMAQLVTVSYKAADMNIGYINRFTTTEPSEVFLLLQTVHRRSVMTPEELLEHTVKLAFVYPRLLMKVREYEEGEPKRARRCAAAAVAYQVKKQRLELQNAQGGVQDPPLAIADVE